MEQETVNKILAETESGYDTIAQKFSQTRKHFWRGLEFIKDYANGNDRVLDYGCGNGRLLELLGDIRGIKYFGADTSQKLIDFAKNKYGSLRANIAEISFQKLNPIQDTIPFNDNFFNSVYSIAVFHHFPSSEYRQKMANEIYRITKDEGRVVVTVWYLWQRKYLKNILKNWKNKIIKLLGGSTSKWEVKPLHELDWNDCYISFTDNQGRRIERFHHAFTKNELKKLFQKAGFQIEKCEIINERNIVLVGRKIAFFDKNTA